MAQRDFKLAERDRVANRTEHQMQDMGWARSVMVIGWLLMIVAGMVLMFASADRRAGGFSTLAIGMPMGIVGLVMVAVGRARRKRVQARLRPKE